MSNTKYRYNPETLSYEEVKLSTRDKIVRGILFVLPSVVLMAIGGIIALTLFKSPNEIKLEREYTALNQKYEDVVARADFMSKVLDDIQDRDDNIYRVIFGADHYPSHLREMGTGGSDKYENLRGLESSDLIIRTMQSLDRLEKRLYAQSKSFDQVQDLAERKQEMLAAIPSIQPVSNEDLTRIASGFGMRIHPVYKIPKMHTGIDFTAPIGTEIYCTGNGVVKDVRYMSGYGKTVVVDHGFGFQSLYAHCNAYNVRPGQKVTKGDVLAFVGNTGVSTGPHLHYEVRRKVAGHFKPVDPVNYFFNDLSPAEYEEVVAKAAQATQSL